MVKYFTKDFSPSRFKKKILLSFSILLKDVETCLDFILSFYHLEGKAVPSENNGVRRL